jgi:REP element-mobilizing transposase RayT
MPQSFICLNCHIVFSTKNRGIWLTDAIRPRLFEYMGGIARGESGCLVAAGGTTDHVHLVVSLGKEMSVAGIVQSVKASSSKWLHETFPRMNGFAWQTGYAAFAVSVSQLDTVKRYIAQQEEHHRVRTFQEEFLALLQRHGIAVDERYLWD